MTSGYTSNGHSFHSYQSGISVSNSGFGLKFGTSIGVGGGFF